MNNPPSPGSKRWIVAQLGAREHYLAARALHGLGALDCLLTDVWSDQDKAVAALGVLPFVKRARRNDHADLADAAVLSWGAVGIGHRLLAGLLARRETWQHRQFNAQGQAFARWAARKTLTRDLAGRIYLGFTSSSLETMQALKARGVRCILDQIDPAETEARLIAEERARWVGWEEHGGGPPAEYFERIRREWDTADRIVVNSEWSRSALVEQGVDARKLVVIPLAFELAGEATRRRGARVSRSRLTVLWLGSVILRKGFPYLVEAARQLTAEPIDFVVAGSHKLSPAVLAALPPNVRLLGKVPSSSIATLFRDADVFVLPTVSDGFAITQLEAMAYGLPVVTTSHCGDVVRDGIDGYIIPARDPGALAARLNVLAHDEALVERMSDAATLRVQDFSVAAYARRLTSLADSL